MRSHTPLLFMLAGCLDLGLPALPPSLHVVSVTAGSAALDRVGRVPILRIRFNHPLATPEPGAVMLLTGLPDSALQTDVDLTPLPATLTSRLLPVSVGRDPADALSLTVTPATPLLPDTPLVLLLTPSLHGTHNEVLSDPDGGLRAEEYALQVAPARQCGALLSLPAVNGVLPSPGRVLVQFDRPVVPSGTGAAIHVLVAGWPIPSQWSLDCLQPDGYALCAWALPAISMARGVTVGVNAAGFVTHAGIAPENSPSVLLNGPPPTVAVPLGLAPACGDGESADGPLCVSAASSWITVRASTQSATVLRAQAVPMAPVIALSGAALSVPGSLHTLTMQSLLPSTTYALTLAPALNEPPGVLWPMGMVTTPPAEASVRITEVLCHPFGGSAQAYIELANDSATDADVSGWVFHMESHYVPLPDGASVPAMARAVVVGEGFNPLGVPDEGDPPVVPGAGVISITGTLSGHGLPSTGSNVALEDPTGTIVSYVPGADPQRAPQEGVGLVRAAQDLADADPAAWSWDAAGSCTPGGPDRLR